MKTVLSLVIIWLLLSFVGYRLGFAIFHPDEMEDLVANGAPVYGRVTAKNRENHASIDYIYSVNGVEYSGTGAAGSGNPSFDEIQVGQQVIVVYETNNPQKSSLGYPQNDLWARYTGIRFFAVIFSLLSLVILVICFLVLRAVRRAKTNTEHASIVT